MCAHGWRGRVPMGRAARRTLAGYRKNFGHQPWAFSGPTVLDARGGLPSSIQGRPKGDRGQIGACCLAKITDAVGGFGQFSVVLGAMAERLNAPVLKTGRPSGLGGSNPPRTVDEEPRSSRGFSGRSGFWCVVDPRSASPRFATFCPRVAFSTVGTSGPLSGPRWVVSSVPVSRRGIGSTEGIRSTVLAASSGCQLVCRSHRPPRRGAS